ncbi:general transcription factor IIE subunit 1-like [Bolinopsis microptera]|uniref:general transcription factor IIE subunit 1-like n=1 Tax=Bolinopsis microptera TaxID=2820187 RepID=UPI0030796C07
MSNLEVDSEDGLKEITQDMRQLIKMVANTFYRAEEALIIDILLKHPCIREDDLIELLKFDKKHVRASLETLRKDKLIKSITKGEKEELGPGGGVLKFNHYFISYKVFIDVVKYKLDRMRKKIDQDDQLHQNCQFHLCKSCDLRFSDLDVKDLIDLETGTLLCQHCDTELVEDEAQLKTLQDRSSVSLFNEQTKSFTEYLKITDNTKLSEDLLAPEPLKLKIAEKRTKNIPLWQNNRKEYNLYAENSIKVNLAGDNDKTETQKKELPIWLSESTVINSNYSTNSNDSLTGAEVSRTETPVSALKDDYISQLIQSEMMTTSSAPTSGSSSPVPDEEEEDEEWLVTVQGKSMPLTEVEGEHVSKMTDKEKELYDQKYREYCDSIMMRVAKGLNSTKTTGIPDRIWTVTEAVQAILLIQTNGLVSQGVRSS